jgi:hypothetical protein
MSVVYILQVTHKHGWLQQDNFTCMRADASANASNKEAMNMFCVHAACHVCRAKAVAGAQNGAPRIGSHLYLGCCKKAFSTVQRLRKGGKQESGLQQQAQEVSRRQRRPSVKAVKAMKAVKG